MAKRGGVTMQRKPSISDEEMQALKPHMEVSTRNLEQVRSRIFLRCCVIAALWLFRIYVISFHPEYHLTSVMEQRLLDDDAVTTLLYVRVSMLTLGMLVYFYSFLTNRYFRSVNVIALIVVCCLIWADIEVYILSNIQVLTLPSVGMIVLRFIPLGLLFMNYLDVRR